MLPVAGGLFQQPASYLSRMKEIIEADAQVDKIKSDREQLNTPEAKAQREQRARDTRH